MLSSEEILDAVLGVSPFGRPDARLVSAVCRAGGLGVLDLGTGDRHAREELARLCRWEPERFGVRVGERCALRPADLDALPPGRPHAVLLGLGSAWPAGELSGYYWVLVEVASREEAVRAVADGADGLVVCGSEGGGESGARGAGGLSAGAPPVGGPSTFVLLQQILADPDLPVPVWACGGIGPRTAAAAVMGGAAGVVLDTQLALLAESGLPERERAVLATMDGVGTTAVNGGRIPRRDQARAALPVDGGRTPHRPRDTPPRHPREPRHPQERPLPVGEDGFLAARFAARWGTAAEAVRGIRTAIAQAAAPPAPRAPGTELPVAQGPMTRVSDCPEFAAAVAHEGGLPFLALALADGEQSRALLTATRAELHDRPWGVGILGFAEEGIREAQLAAVREARPSHAVIAGGRPGQAAELEAAGIRTFLHVPSAVLLRQYLDAGARRFVFEGSECGGHVGPLASFPLWEAQLAVLEEYADAGPEVLAQTQVMFAGGIHDARSSAMVTALTAPLAARGMAVGVLMGTAYLFTREAVALGAVQPGFQRQVVAAESTALLRTAPGHATRCVPSPFTATFAVEEERLREQGLAPERRWAELERLNLGRLRIASKGVERRDGELLTADEPRQLAAGMFMAGQVSLLRTRPTTIRALHTEVGAGAADFLAARRAALRPRFPLPEPSPTEAAMAPEPLDVAVVGMACMFPRADGLDAYWAQILDGTDAVTEVPADRWDPAVHYGADSGRTPSRWGGFLPRIPFDPLSYGIPPASLGAIEPVQLLALEAARRALDDAGYADRSFDRSRASVIFGAEAGSDLAHATTLRTVLPSYVDSVPEALSGQLPRLTEDSFPGMLANVISGRIANRLDLGGANYTVDAACASSLAAVDAACKELVHGTSDLVLCGGADLHNGINDYLLFASVGAMSPTGRCRTFDAAADGIALGEGVACVVLKRLADAERDGDRVYAVIRGVGRSSDGRSLGLTAPGPAGQRAALERAYAQARISPAEVGLVEAHGTGTVVGDRTELAVLTQVFTEAGAGTGDCALGSVKSQIGHTKCAAGLAGLIKTSLALHTGVLPPTCQLTRPNPAWDPHTSPFSFHTEARPWAAAPAERRAGVSAFGFGGTNFHVVLRAHEGGAPPSHGHAHWPAELFTFRGDDQEAAAREVRWLLDLVDQLDRGPTTPRLRDVAATAARRAAGRPGPVRIAVVARDVDSLSGLLRRASAGEDDPAAGIFVGGVTGSGTFGDGGRVAFLFPGQGSQRPGMSGELLIAFPETQQHLRLGSACAQALYPPADFIPDADERSRAGLTDTRNAQPALGIAGLATADLLTRAGVRPDMAAGHSYGELVALCAAGAFTPDDLLALSTRRAEAIVDAAGEDAGAMAAVGAGEAATLAVLRGAGQADQVVLANLNAPDQCVISGSTSAVRAAVAALGDAGHGAKMLPVACAFHSPLVAGAGPVFAEALAEVTVRETEFPVWANATAAPYPYSPEAIRAGLAAQIASPVRFAAQIEAMYEAGARIFVEVGPGRVLSTLVGRVLGDDRPHRTIPTEPHAGAGLPGFLTALARLAVEGVPVDTGWLFHGRATTDLADPEGSASAGASPGWTVDGHLVRDASGEPLPGALRPARRITLEADVSDAGRPDRDELLTEFLRGTREVVAAQRDVLMAYFGGSALAAAGSVEVPLPEQGQETETETASVRVPAPEPVAAPVPAPREPATGADLLDAVLRIISGRTGYPADMIEPDLDLEADLGIDSIKRTEIAGELAGLLGGGADAMGLGDTELEALSRARTAEAITQWLTARRVASTGVGASEARRNETRDDVPLGTAPKRYVVGRVPLPLPPGAADLDLTGKRFAVLGGAPSGAGPSTAMNAERGTPRTDRADRVARSVTAELRQRGADVVLLDRDHELTDASAGAGGDRSTPNPNPNASRPHAPHLDGVIHLGALAEGAPPALPTGFAAYVAVLAPRPAWLIAACPVTGAAGAGLPGLFRTVAHEYPATNSRLVRVAESSAWPPDEELARALVAELSDPQPEPVVDHTPEGRFVPRAEAAPPGPSAHRGAGPAGGDGSAEVLACGLTRESVVVLAGGGRGITARFALALATAARCRVELLGRTPLPDTPEGPETAAARDRAELRAALAAQGDRNPAEVDRTAGLILAQREVAATLAELGRLGSPARYHVTDLRDPDAVDRALKEVMAEYGRIDGVVGGAGVIEDRLMVDKDAASFARVYGTKVDGARHLLDAAAALYDPQHPLFAVLFGSVSAVLGNRGQCDYAAANDALESLGADWSARTGNRALTVHWGPWAPTGGHAGMVTPELGRDYARRGVRLIDPDEGVLALLRELAWGDPAATSVVLTASTL
ncbi:type I polyketide synthase [Streptomyces sp. Je 1-369]|uniref:type I polyketide synthase n=1 Tax=Streptomyces sp. Je 1-369 TaxID=2966192 RepID=UPI00228617BC|nr:type I polyketide synthase [Streptomyces sp. Je 1-369]WAL99676.1 SDR family oxidoreductase [Streptomyces sp. Je 1-369]